MKNKQFKRHGKKFSTTLAVGVISTILISSFFPLPAFAQTVESLFAPTYEGISISGGEENVDYSFSDHVLKITGKQKHDFILSGSSETARVRVDSMEGGSITLSNLSIKAHDGAPFTMNNRVSKGGSIFSLNLLLVGKNLLQTTFNNNEDYVPYAGLEKNDSDEGPNPACLLTISAPQGGALKAVGACYGAGIGASSYETNRSTSYITINSGTIEAYGRAKETYVESAKNVSESAGIGGAASTRHFYSSSETYDGGDCSFITINGGNITAACAERGISSGAGIGGGACDYETTNPEQSGGSLYNLRISGATVNSASSFDGFFSYGAAIGGGGCNTYYGGNAEHLSFEKSEIKAVAGTNSDPSNPLLSQSAGIGGGKGLKKGGDLNDLIVKGCKIEAGSGGYPESAGAGIGGGAALGDIIKSPTSCGGNASNIYIENSTLTCYCQKGESSADYALVAGAGIGGGGGAKDGGPSEAGSLSHLTIKNSQVEAFSGEFNASGAGIGGGSYPEGSNTPSMKTGSCTDVLIESSAVKACSSLDGGLGAGIGSGGSLGASSGEVKNCTFRSSNIDAFSGNTLGGGAGIGSGYSCSGNASTAKAGDVENLSFDDCILNIASCRNQSPLQLDGPAIGVGSMNTPYPSGLSEQGSLNNVTFSGCFLAANYGIDTTNFAAAVGLGNISSNTQKGTVSGVSFSPNGEPGTSVVIAQGSSDGVIQGCPEDQKSGLIFTRTCDSGTFSDWSVEDISDAVLLTDMSLPVSFDLTHALNIGNACHEANLNVPSNITLDTHAPLSVVNGNISCEPASSNGSSDAPGQVFSNVKFVDNGKEIANERFLAYTGNPSGTEHLTYLQSKAFPTVDEEYPTRFLGWFSAPTDGASLQASDLVATEYLTIFAHREDGRSLPATGDNSSLVALLSFFSFDVSY